MSLMAVYRVEEGRAMFEGQGLGVREQGIENRRQQTVN
jgi:hypothetical protein